MTYTLTELTIESPTPNSCVPIFMLAEIGFAELLVYNSYGLKIHRALSLISKKKVTQKIFSFTIVKRDCA